MGWGKLGAKIGAIPLIRWSAEAANRAGFRTRVLIVASASAPDYGLDSEGWEIVVNSEAETGLASSIRAAASHACNRDRLVLGLADMPFISAGHLRRIATAKGVIFTRYPSGRNGVPAGFDRPDLNRLQAVQGDAGAATLGWTGANAILPPTENELFDVDTPQDLEVARQIANPDMRLVKRPLAGLP